MRAPTHIFSGPAQDNQDSAAAEAMHTCRSTSSVAGVGISGHSEHLPRSVAAMSASLAVSIRAICSSTSVTVCISDRRLVCSNTGVGRVMDHYYPRLLRWSRAQTIQVWTGIFFRTMIKTIKHIGHKTSISVGRLDAAQNVQLNRRET